VTAVTGADDSPDFHRFMLRKPRAMMMAPEPPPIMRDFVLPVSQIELHQEEDDQLQLDDVLCKEKMGHTTGTTKQQGFWSANRSSERSQWYGRYHGQ
jgi:hypothetical protein